MESPSESLTGEAYRSLWVCRFAAPASVGRKRTSSASADLQRFLPDAVNSSPWFPGLPPMLCSHTDDGVPLLDCSCSHGASASASADVCRTAHLFPFLHFPLVPNLQCPKCFIKGIERNVLPFAPPAFTSFITTMRASDCS